MNAEVVDKKRFDFIFLFSSMPALTGFFFSIFDFLILILFFLSFFNNPNFSKKSLSLFLFATFSLVSSLLVGVDYFNLEKAISNFFLLFVIFSCHHLISRGFFSVHRAFFYWALGIVPSFVVLIFQQLYPGLEVFNFNELKSNPLPGTDLIRASGLLYNPNSFAAYSLICFLIFIYSNQKIFSIISLFSALLTFSKTFFIAPVLLFLRFFLKFDCKGWFVLFFLVVFFAFSLSDFVFYFFEYRLLNADSLSSRSSIVLHYLSKEFGFINFIFGHGVFADSDDVGRIHNKYISVYYQFGIIGLFAFLVFMLAPFFYVFRSKVDADNKIFFVLALLTVYSLAMVSTFTFFSFDYIIVLLLLALIKENKAFIKS